jgi:hypothetical protein
MAGQRRVEGRSRRTRHRSSISRLLGLGSAVGTLLCLLAAPGSAEVGAASTFAGTASARLVAVDIRAAPTVVFDPLFDGGQSVAQAQLDSLGTSRAFAASAYPGSTVLALPGTLATVTKGKVGSDQIPRYPLYVDSSDPTKPSDHQTVGAYDLAADSTSIESRATATDGATKGAASVTVDPANGDVVARAVTTIAAVRVNDQLTLNGVRSLAEARQSPSGEVRRASTFEVDSVVILGQQVTITAEGLSLLGQKVPIGGVLQQTVQPLLAVLAAQGTTIELVPAGEFPEGVITTALRISTTAAAPAALASGVKSITTTFTFGGNVASVSNQALPTLNATTPIVAPGSSSAPSAPRSSGSGRPSAAPAPGRPTTSDGGWTPGVAGASPNSSLIAGAAPGSSLIAGAVPGSSLVAGTAPDSSLVATVPSDISATGFYPVLVAAGVALFGAARLFPHLVGRSS